MSWTTDTTEGFTAEQLAELSAAQAALEAEHGVPANEHDDTGSDADIRHWISASLNNSWTEDCWKRDDLIAAVRARNSV